VKVFVSSDLLSTGNAEFESFIQPHCARISYINQEPNAIVPELTGVFTWCLNQIPAESSTLTVGINADSVQIKFWRFSFGGDTVIGKARLPDCSFLKWFIQYPGYGAVINECNTDNLSTALGEIVSTSLNARIFQNERIFIAHPISFLPKKLVKDEASFFTVSRPGQNKGDGSDRVQD
jgi:hypothetical protein